MGNDPTPVLFQNNTHPLASKLTVSWDAENIKASEIGIGTNKLLKYVSKLQGHFVRSFDNFVIFHSIAVFSSKMQSMGNEGIFQKNFFKLMEIYVGEKER